MPYQSSPEEQNMKRRLMDHCVPIYHNLVLQIPKLTQIRRHDQLSDLKLEDKVSTHRMICPVSIILSDVVHQDPTQVFSMISKCSDAMEQAKILLVLIPQ